MPKHIVFAFCGYFISVGLLAQTSEIESVLQEVEQNNKELKAMASNIESQRLELKSTNNLPDPQFGAYLLPFGEHSATGNYTEFQISQTIEFPTVYGARGSLIDNQSIQLDLEYKSKRQEILAQAKRYCLNMIYLNKQLDIEILRVAQVKQVYEQANELYKKEQIGILEINKAKVAWMQEQFKVQQIESDKKNLSQLLANLNGGNEVKLSLNEYLSPLVLAAKDSLWKDKLSNDPELIELKQQESIAFQSLKLAKNKNLPNLTAGFNSQGVSGERFSGFYAGISIPLWSNRNKVKAAQSRVDYQESFTSSMTMQASASFEKQYNDYQIMLTKFQEYQSTLSGLNSDTLLLQAYQSGEISFMEYYGELQFYRQAFDAMLDMQYQLYLSQTALLKYQL